jgi:hypothetical protein
MKKGIALLITIGFITIFVSLIAYMLTTSQRVLQKTDRLEHRNQSLILYRDAKVIVDRFVKDIKNSVDLDDFLSSASYLSYANDDLSLSIELQPLSNKVNINSILINKKIDKNIVDFLKKISVKYNLLDVDFLISLILDTIDKDESPREIGSEISTQDIKFSNSRIIDFSHFQTLMDYYIKNTQDENILKIPWDKLIFFGESKKGMIDCSRMDISLVDILGFDKESYSGCSDLNQTEDYKALAQKYDIKAYSKGDNYYIFVSIVQAKDSTKEKISFMYDLKTSKASEIELFYN